MKKFSLFPKAFGILLGIFFFAGCEDPEPVPAGNVTIEVSMPANIDESSADITAQISTEGGFQVTEKGLCWSTITNPDIDDEMIMNGSGAGLIKSKITGLNPATTYYLRAFVVDDAGVITYGNQVSFSTLATQAPAPTIIVTTNNASNITTTSATLGGNISGTGGAHARGVCWSTAPDPVIGNNSTSNGMGMGSFTSEITGLEANTTYYVRAYGKNDVSGTTYGNEVSFTTPGGSLAVSTESVEVFGPDVSVNFAVTGTDEITTKGICWSKTPEPTIDSDKNESSETLSGSSALDVHSLEECTMYYVRAFAISASGQTYYGNELTFRSPAGPSGECNPLIGLWERSDKSIIKGTGDAFEFYYVPPTTDLLSWRNAIDQGFVSIGSNYIFNVVKVNDITWECTALWISGTTTDGVTEVKESTNSSITLSQDGNSFTLTSISPFNGRSGSVTFNRK